MRKLKEGKNAKALARELFYMFLPYREFVHSITSDNGSEFYEHRYIAKKPGAEYYFALPYSSWERGLNEYTNGLIRQYIPKKQSFDSYSNDDLLLFRHKINRRPRKLLNFDSPLSRLISNINKKVAFIT
jgi:IS30 family transposase